MYQEKELSNMNEYRNKFERKNEVMRNRQVEYEEKVMSPSMHKDFLQTEFIKNNVEQYNREQEMRAKAEREARNV